MKLFDLIAPIHIYFKVDLMYKKEAEKSFNELNKYPNLPSDLEEEIQNTDKLDDLDYQLIWKYYNELFEEIVFDVINEFWGKDTDFYADYDEYGAKCINYKPTMKKIFCGDGYDEYSAYLDESYLRKNAKERMIEIEQEYYEMVDYQ